MNRSTRLALAIGALTCGTVPTAAETHSFRAEYSVSLLGLTIGRGTFDSTFTPDRFTIRGSVGSAGLARVFDKTSAVTEVQGTVRRDTAQPRSYRITYISGRKKGDTTISFSGNGVESFENVPPTPERARWVPLSSETLRAAVDPLTSTLIRTDDPTEVCDRTVPFFDGELRADLRFSHAGMTQVPGFAGDGVTCNVSFVPVAGYQQGREQIEFLKNRSRISITFVKLGETGFYTPAAARVGTQVGTLRVTAERIESR